MPRPVDALPCGSRSTTSTFSPIAASAVPRLIAVVVLPTPPFWLARARTRGMPGSVIMAAHSEAKHKKPCKYSYLAFRDLPHENDASLRVGSARDPLGF